MAKSRSKRLRVLLTALVAAVFLGVFWWLASEVRFRVFQARQVQTRLFGTPIASYWTLNHASNGCCAMDASGLLEWTYTIPAWQAAQLAKRCRLPNGDPKPFTDTRSPYFDEHTKQCVVARNFDRKLTEDADAQVEGNHLIIRLFYIDPELVKE
jgi:hypothetical protein